MATGADIAARPLGRPRRGGWLLALLAGCAGAARGPSGRPSSGPVAVLPPERPRAAWLEDGAAAVWAGHLGEAQRALLEIADREGRRPDPALDFWVELVALLRCEPVGWLPRPSRALVQEWDQLRRLVQIERLRVEATLPSPPRPVPAGKRRPSAPAVPAPIKPNHWLRVNAPPAGALIWPVEAESWPDEAPAARAVADLCPATPSAVAPASALELRAAPEAMMVRELTAALPPNHPALPALLFEAAVLAISSGDPAGALHPLGQIPASAMDDRGPFSEGERAQLAMTWAIAADADAMVHPDHLDSAVLRLRAAGAADLSHAVRRVLAFRLSEQLRAAGRVAEATAAIGPPPHGNDSLGNYLAFRQTEAHVKAGRHAEALAEAREALNRHARAVIDADPALAAIDDLAMRVLIGSPVTPESIEVIEALGDPSERRARVERFAQLAEALGAHASGMEAFLWLMRNDPDENRRLHHLARASVAAARAGDRAQFSRTFALLAGEEDRQIAGLDRTGPDRAIAGHAAREKPAKDLAKPDGLIDTPDAERLYRSRQHERSVSWQRALLVVARDALPALVESDDQANLKVLVDRLQRHLTAHGRGPVDAELTTVYRAASAHLRVGARGYAERVGDGRRPILLGDIAVERRYEVTPPSFILRPWGPRSLLWVPAVGTDPSAGHLRRWMAPLGVSLAVAEPARP